MTGWEARFSESQQIESKVIAHGNQKYAKCFDTAHRRLAPTPHPQPRDAKCCPSPGALIAGTLARLAFGCVFSEIHLFLALPQYSLTTYLPYRGGSTASKTASRSQFSVATGDWGCRVMSVVSSVPQFKRTNVPRERIEETLLEQESNSAEQNPTT